MERLIFEDSKSTITALQDELVKERGLRREAERESLINKTLLKDEINSRQSQMGLTHYR